MAYIMAWTMAYPMFCPHPFSLMEHIKALRGPNGAPLVRDHSCALLPTLNEAHPFMQWTIEAATDSRLPFVGIKIIKTDHHL